jgi:hypothetical protein
VAAAHDLERARRGIEARGRVIAHRRQGLLFGDPATGSEPTDLDRDVREGADAVAQAPVRALGAVEREGQIADVRARAARDRALRVQRRQAEAIDPIEALDEDVAAEVLPVDLGADVLEQRAVIAAVPALHDGAHLVPEVVRAELEALARLEARRDARRVDVIVVLRMVALLVDEHPAIVAGAHLARQVRGFGVRPVDDAHRAHAPRVPVDQERVDHRGLAVPEEGIHPIGQEAERARGMRAAGDRGERGELADGVVVRVDRASRGTRPPPSTPPRRGA